LMLDISFNMKEESECVINAVDEVLKKGFRTKDIANENTPSDKILGTNEIGQQVLQALEAQVAVSN